jgi:hypothetical protein
LKERDTTRHRIILVGQLIEAAGLWSITGDLTWLGVKRNAIFGVGVGCAAMGVSACVLETVIIPEMREAILR